MSSFAKFRLRSKWYYGRPAKGHSLISQNVLRKVELPRQFQGTYYDEKYDLRDKDKIDVSEAMRGPLERDFYQDHTYHSPWIARELKGHQKAQLRASFRWMLPGYQEPSWIWFPGDLVEVSHGEFAGQRGTILSVIAYKNQCTVQNVNVQPIHIPATEDRPAQTLQREHPISVKLIKHVDPNTNQPCDVKIVTVRNKETGAVEKRRISLASGVMFPIPSREEKLEGDPTKDTPLVDAQVETFDHDREIGIMVERKLKAIESHFVERLQTAYRYHKQKAEMNYEETMQYQRDVLKEAVRMVAQRAASDGTVKEWWWQEHAKTENSDGPPGEKEGEAE